MSDRRPFIATYIMASGRNGTLYTGSTSNLEERVWQHKSGAFGGFTNAYGCDQVVWFEQHALMTSAIAREQRIKKWLRDWNLALIEGENPDWRDLAAGWFAAMDSGAPPAAP